MAPTTPYDQFDATKADSFWGCETRCGIIKTHQSNSTAGVNDMLLLNDGDMTGTAQATQFANKQVNFVWGFTTCTTGQAVSPTSGPFTPAMGSSISAGDSRDYTDPIPACPDMNTVSHTGTTTLGSGGLLVIVLSPGGGFPAYLSNFVLQLSSSDTNPSVSSPVTTSATQSSTNSSSNTVLTTGATNGSGIPTNVPSVTAVWGSSGPEGSTSTSPGTSGGKNDSSTPAANQGITIGGAVAGVVAAMLVVIIIWITIRRRNGGTEAQEKSVDKPFKTGHIHPFPNIARANEQNPEVGASSRDTSDSTPFIINPNRSGIPPPVMASGRAPSAVFSATDPPAYDSLSNIMPRFITPAAE